MTFKKFCEIFGIQSTTDHNGKWILKCTKEQLIVFIYGDEHIESSSTIDNVGVEGSILKSFDDNGEGKRRESLENDIWKVNTS
jgi:hypothetical protein